MFVHGLGHSGSVVRHAQSAVVADVVSQIVELTLNPDNTVSINVTPPGPATFTLTSEVPNYGGTYNIDTTALSSGPIYLVDVAISGTGQVGQTLSATEGLPITDASAGGVSKTYQWQSNGVDIPGATSATYVVGAAYAETDISVNEIATDGNGATVSASNVIAIAAASAAPLTEMGFAASPSAAAATSKSFAAVDTSAQSGTDDVFILVTAHANNVASAAITGVTVDGSDASLVPGTVPTYNSGRNHMSAVFRLTGVDLPAASDVVVNSPSGNIDTASVQLFTKGGVTSVAGYAVDESTDVTMQVTPTVAVGSDILAIAAARNSTTGPPTWVGVTAVREQSLPGSERALSASATDVGSGAAYTISAEIAQQQPNGERNMSGVVIA